MSRFFAALVSSAFVLSSTNLLAQVNALPSLPHLLVKGEASRAVVPDRFTVSVTLTAVDTKPEVARATVQRNLAALLSTIKQGDAIVDSVDATTFSIGPEYEYENEKRVFKGTKATRQLRVTFPSADTTQQFLAQLQASEDVQLGGIEPTFSGELTLRSQLKADAMRQTRETAALLASSYGANVGRLYSVSDVAPNFAYGIQAGHWPAARRRAGSSSIEEREVRGDASKLDSIVVTGTQITPESLAVGKITITENLYAIFLLAD